MTRKPKGLEYRRIDQLPTREYGRRPDFWVKMWNKLTDEKRKIGAAWRNDDQSISISLDPFTLVHSAPEILITLFPLDRVE